MNKEEKVGLLMAYVGVLILMLMLMVNAETVYSGESYSFASEEYDYYSVVGNSTSLEGMVVDYVDGNITISFDKYFQSDEFTIVFFNNEEVIVNYYSSGGGSSGGTRTIYKDKNVTQIVEVPGEKTTEIVTETITETIETNKTPTWVWIVIGILGSIVLFFIIMLIWEYSGIVNVSPDLANPDMS